MSLTRRDFLGGAAVTGLATSAALGTAIADTGSARAPVAAAGPPSLPDFPARAEFPTGDLVYLDSGSQHPMSQSGRAAIERYLAKRALEPAALAYSLPDDAVRAKFARLVGADPEEIAYVPSTTAAEQMFVRGLGLPAPGAHVVTDTLHFFGSMPLYEELARQGCSVTWVRHRDGRIDPADLRAALRPETRLVALSLVSTINGFEHDLKSVCDAAHARGAVVYADIIHAAGAVPLDLHATGVDFAACATYKWLMGEFGLGFGYVARHARERLRRTEYGYYGLAEFHTHAYPFDAPSDRVADYRFTPDAEGTLAHGTHAHTVIALLDRSLDYLLATGVDRINAYVRTLTEQLKRELPRRGYPLLTPVESRAPIVACPLENARERLAPRLQAAKVRLTLAQHRFRVTPSVFNTPQDIDYLLGVLERA